MENSFKMRSVDKNRVRSVVEVEDTERMFAAVASDGAARVRLVDRLKARLFQYSARRRYHLGRGGRVGEEHLAFIRRVELVERICTVFCDDLFHPAAVFFIGDHLAVLQNNAGAEFQEIGAQKLQAGASAALVEVVQPLDDERNLELLRARLHFFVDVFGRKPLIRQPAGV